MLNVPLIGCGVSVLLFAGGFRRLGARLPRVDAAAVLFAMFGVCFATAGVLPLSDPADPRPLQGILHFVIGFFLGMSSLIAALWVTATALRLASANPGHRRYTVVTATLVTLLVPLTFVFFSPGSPLERVGIGGAMERGLFAVFLAWFAGSSWRMGSGTLLPAAEVRGDAAVGAADLPSA